MIRYICILPILLFFISCGIEEGFYVLEPRALTAEGSNENLLLKFTAFNQEKGDEGKVLLFGYDIYYSFPGDPTPRLAMVKNPELSNAELKNIYTLFSSRYSGTSFSTLEFYQFVSIPVIESWINDILGDGKDFNVRFTFNDTNWDLTAEKNPYAVGTSYIIFANIYPSFTEYKTQKWGGYPGYADPALRAFGGFYDKDFYEYRIPKIEPESSVGGFSTYVVNFYVVARGFRNDIAGSFNTGNIDYSAQSNQIQVRFKVADTTLGN